MTLTYVHVGESKQRVIQRNDWVTMDANQLLARVAGAYNLSQDANKEALQEKRHSSIVDSFRVMRNDNGEIVGRASIIGQNYPLLQKIIPPFGVVTVGGLRSTQTNRTVAGIITGVPTRASRDSASPIVDFKTLSQWATDQAILACNAALPPSTQSQVAHTVRLNGGQTGPLVIALSASGWLNVEDIQQWARSLMEVELLVSMGWSSETGSKILLPNMLLIEATLETGILPVNLLSDKKHNTHSVWWAQYPYTVLGAVIEAISKSWQRSPEDVLQTSVAERSFQRSVILPFEHNSISGYLIRKPKS